MARRQQEEVDLGVEEAPRPRRDVAVAAEPGEAGVAPAQEAPPPEPQGEYELHIRLAREMQPILQASTQLAYKMGEIEKPTLEELMNLFIVWGLAIQKRKWLDRMGYH